LKSSVGKSFSLMEQTLKKWGNSLALRLPKRIAEELNLKEGSKVDIKIEGGKIVIVPKKELKELLESIKSDNLHKETDWGQREGNEIW
jgi:antitoxin MazE